MAGSGGSEERTGSGKNKSRCPESDAYEEAGRSLARIVDRSAEAVRAWSDLAKTAGDEAVRKAAASALESSAERKMAAESLLKGCCLDGKGRIDVVQGTWTAEIAAGAEGMAAIASRAASRWSARGAMRSEPTELPVLAEMSVSDAWLGFAKKVGAAQAAAEGTALAQPPVDVMAGMAARRAEREAMDGNGGGTDAAEDPEAAGRRAAEEVMEQAAREAKESAEILSAAVDVWTQASTEWSRARDLASADGDAETASMAAERARSANENAARLRAA